jgi:hypothetical protein
MLSVFTLASREANVNGDNIIHEKLLKPALPFATTIFAALGQLSHKTHLVVGSEQFR